MQFSHECRKIKIKLDYPGMVKFQELPEIHILSVISLNPKFLSKAPNSLKP